MKSTDLSLRLPLLLSFAACSGAAFAQAPAGVVTTPSPQSDPNAAGGKAATKAETKVETRKAVGSTLSAPDPIAGTGGAAPSEKINPSASGGKAAARAEMKVDAKVQKSMDANGDGMLTRDELIAAAPQPPAETSTDATTDASAEPVSTTGEA